MKMLRIQEAKKTPPVGASVKRPARLVRLSLSIQIPLALVNITGVESGGDRGTSFTNLNLPAQELPPCSVPLPLILDS